MEDEIELEIKIEKYLYDSLSVIIGKVENNVLIDTAGVLFVADSIAYLAFVPHNYGPGKIQGVVQDIKIDEDKLIIKTVPFEIEYYVQ